LRNHGCEDKDERHNFSLRAVEKSCAVSGESWIQAGALGASGEWSCGPNQLRSNQASFKPRAWGVAFERFKIRDVWFGSQSNLSLSDNS
jgi:hypothetical protein